MKLVVLIFVPLPIDPKLTRPDPKKNLWTFTCDAWMSPYQLAKVAYIESDPHKFTK